VTALVWVLGAAGLLVIVWVGLLSSARVRRLHRLHIRTDAAAAGLESALRRRAAAALAVAAAPGTQITQVEALRVAVARTRAAGSQDGDRESAENLLSRALAAADRAGLRPAVLEELVDAEQLVILARRVYNDAVRDTLALRSRRLVRWLHLAGTAPMPAYFEIADADAGVTTAAPARLPERPVAPPR
jgi:hypothetical protein